MKQDTIAIHEGYNPLDNNGSMTPPLYQTTAYAFRDTDHGKDLFTLKELGPIYTRLNNPTTDLLEQRYAKFEGGAAALCVSSGQAASFYSIANVAQSGDNILVSDKLYGGTATLFTHTIKKFGIEARVFNSDDALDLEEQIDNKTKAIFFESLSNPQISIAAIEEIVAIGKKHGIVTICDNTVITSVLFNPIEWGVDIVVHSTSKYINGQGTTIGGIIVEREGMAEFFKNNSERYPFFTEPDESYHGLVYVDVPLPTFTLRARLSLLRDIGATQSPYNSWLLLNSLETLSLRVGKHSDNAKKVAEFLESHPMVKEVYYPGLKSNKYNDKVEKYFKDGKASGLVAFDTLNYNDAKKVMDNVKIFKIVTNIGDTKSVVTHPASTTHSQLNEKELALAGIKPTSIRVSVGLEDPEDLINDLRQALEK